jgi:hypothetical protein
MPSSRQWRERLGRELAPPFWPLDAEAVPEGLGAINGMEAVGPLFSFLSRGGLLMWRAVLVLGGTVASIAERDPETARTVMRRCMWHLNGDSGNLGWGIAEAMGEILAQSPRLAAEYGRIALSYANDTGKADNHIDFAPLKKGVYWAIGRAAPACPALHREAFALLLRGCPEKAGGAAGAAAWGLGKLAAAYVPEPADRDEALKTLDALSASDDACDILDGLAVREASVGVFAREAYAVLAGHMG